MQSSHVLSAYMKNWGSSVLFVAVFQNTKIQVRSEQCSVLEFTFSKLDKKFTSIYRRRRFITRMIGCFAMYSE